MKPENHLIVRNVVPSKRTWWITRAHLMGRWNPWTQQAAPQKTTRNICIHKDDTLSLIVTQMTKMNINLVTMIHGQTNILNKIDQNMQTRAILEPPHIPTELYLVISGLDHVKSMLGHVIWELYHAMLAQHHHI